MKCQYDSYGRMKYNSEIHFNHKKSWDEEDLIYLCKFYKWGERRDMAFTLGRTESTIAEMVCRLKKQNKFEYYKKLWDSIGGVG